MRSTQLVSLLLPRPSAHFWGIRRIQGYSDCIRFFTHIWSTYLTAAHCVLFFTHIWSTCLTAAHCVLFFAYIWSAHLRASTVLPNLILSLPTTDGYYNYCVYKKHPDVSAIGAFVLHLYTYRLNLKTNNSNLAQIAAFPPTYTLIAGIVAQKVGILL